MVYLAHWLGSQQGRNLRLTLSLSTVNVEVFSLDLVVLIRLLLLLKSDTLLVNFSLGKDTGLDENLLLSLRLQVHLHSVISLLGVLTLFLRTVVGITKLLLDFGIELKGLLLLFRPEHPLGHLAERSPPLVSKEIVVHEHLHILTFLSSSPFPPNLYPAIFSHNTVLLL